MLFRTGESEYLLNGVPCRLLDIQELLSDTGIGRQQHVIVGQGQLDAVLERAARGPPGDHRGGRGDPQVPQAQGEGGTAPRRDRGQPPAPDRPAARGAPPAATARTPGRRGAPPRRSRRRSCTRSACTSRGARSSSCGAASNKRVEARRDLAQQEQDVRVQLRGFDAEVLDAEHALAVPGDDDVADVLARTEALRERSRGLVNLVTERVPEPRPGAGVRSPTRGSSSRSSRKRRTCAAQLAAVDGDFGSLAPTRVRGGGGRGEGRGARRRVGRGGRERVPARRAGARPADASSAAAIDRRARPGARRAGPGRHGPRRARAARRREADAAQAEADRVRAEVDAQVGRVAGAHGRGARAAHGRGSAPRGRRRAPSRRQRRVALARPRRDARARARRSARAPRAATTSPRSTVCSVRSSTCSRSTKVARSRSRPRSATRCKAIVVDGDDAARAAVERLKRGDRQALLLVAEGRADGHADLVRARGHASARRVGARPAPGSRFGARPPVRAVRARRRRLGARTRRRAREPGRRRGHARRRSLRWSVGVAGGPVGIVGRDTGRARRRHGPRRRRRSVARDVAEAEVEIARQRLAAGAARRAARDRGGTAPPRRARTGDRARRAAAARGRGRRRRPSTPAVPRSRRAPTSSETVADRPVPRPRPNARARLARRSAAARRSARRGAAELERLRSQAAALRRDFELRGAAVEERRTVLDRAPGRGRGPPRGTARRRGARPRPAAARWNGAASAIARDRGAARRRGPARSKRWPNACAPGGASSRKPRAKPAAGSTGCGRERAEAEKQLTDLRDAGGQARSRRSRDPSCGSSRRWSRSAATSTASPTPRSPRPCRRCPTASRCPGRARELERELRLMGPVNPLALTRVRGAAGAARVPAEATRRRAQHAPRARRGHQVGRRGDRARLRLPRSPTSRATSPSCSRCCSPAVRAVSCSPSPKTC